MSDDNTLVVREDRDGTAVLTVNRPRQHNALNRGVQDALRGHLADIAGDAGVGAVVVTGAGEDAFVAGADINELAQRTPVDGLAGPLQRLFDTVAAFPKPTIAAVNGYAFGGGHELALACDVRVGSTAAQFAFPETGLGIIPSAGGTRRLAEVVGQGAALDMILTGRRLTAEEALRMNLVTYLVEPSELLETALAVARRIRRKGPLATSLVRDLVRRSGSVDRESGMLLERLAQAVIYSSEEKREGTRAFQEKRRPDFDSVRHDAQTPHRPDTEETEESPS
ncbi:enoyl-CoA hydratase-related protein [Corynebacterium sp.]|jgi:enoyl-CoA hydratase|uniref:enoyl-CoA hydratase/isomerase family protein n=1 Tax=Corynebacterium sp. TaxID=1720 RepID=UPI0025BC5702|nr:enoyl-CoA hydratase-related protein [Corynebacterium sp.]